MLTFSFLFFSSGITIFAGKEERCLSYTNVLPVELRSKLIITTLIFCRQALHFSYGVGGFVSPLVAQPFLRRRCVLVVNYTTIIDEWPYANSTSGIDNSTHIFHSQEEMQRDTHVRWAYWIVALMHVSTANFSSILSPQ